MSQSRSRRAATRVLFAALFAVHAACREDKPSPPPAEPSSESPQPAIPRAESPTPEAARPAAPSRSEPTTPRPVPSLPTGESTAAVPRPTAEAGVQDDPAAPAYLPNRFTGAGWFKHEPVQWAAAGELSRFLSPEEAARFAHFRIGRTARCAYALQSAGGTRVAQVTVVETESPEDAYGVTTCQPGADGLVDAGGWTRVDRSSNEPGTASGFALHCWQGRNYVRVRESAANSGSQDDLAALLRQIVGRMRREPVPPVMEAMPTESARPGGRWMVRRLESLPSGAMDWLPALDRAKVSELLGLDGETCLCITAYDVPSAKRPNTVWLVSYPTPEAAREAHARYQSHVTFTGGPGWDSTNLLKPRGRFLVGTWTAEEESLQYMMNRIDQLLPS